MDLDFWPIKIIDPMDPKKINVFFSFLFKYLHLFYNLYIYGRLKGTYSYNLTKSLICDMFLKVPPNMLLYLLQYTTYVELIFVVYREFS